jgi:hypothetical protein
VADDNLRDQVADAILAVTYPADEWPDGPPGEGEMDTAREQADAAMAVFDDAALGRMAERLLEETNLRAMDFRNGMSMELEPAQALAANFVGAARAMLGEAPNYSETSFEFGLAGERERFAFIVQRVAPGKLTPHEARQAAEQRADEAVTELARLRAGEADDPGPADTMPTPAQWIRRWNDATAERRLEVITRILGELDRATRCFEMDHENRLAEAKLVARQLADAPTRWAYDQACKVLWRHRRRADVAEAANARVQAVVQALVDDVRANTDEPGELINAQLLLDAVATALLPADGLTPAQSTTPDLTEGEVKFLADLVGGTGNFVWGDLARNHGMDGRDVERLFRKLAGHTDPSAEAARREGCVDHMPTPNPDCEACTR